MSIRLSTAFGNAAMAQCCQCAVCNASCIELRAFITDSMLMPGLLKRYLRQTCAPRTPTLWCPA